ncbi:hypothetical protein HPB50_025395 [Hyalomma asiaticum]|uniref:Uncharacterized protein n=1 Tax=Hyalomma asiaticum TaxID=266040 RepID=A0ACB7S5U1_HYAAI|nr:hypothetical protein HPB50_025395 [Hyalomma asiaticum]
MSRYVAVAVLELDFERLDINQCPIGSGNPRPNYFAGTSRCKNDTTECEPVHGYGFRRGGYQCRCRPGFRRPRIVRNPYHGELIERATEHDYRTGFHCEKIGYLMVQTQNLLRIAEEDRIRFIGMQANHMAILNISSGANKDPRFIFTRMKAHLCRRVLECVLPAHARVIISTCIIVEVGSAFRADSTWLSSSSSGEAAKLQPRVRNACLSLLT